VVLLFGSLFAGKATFGLFFLLITFAGMREFYLLVSRNGIYPQVWPGIAAGFSLFLVIFLFFSGYVNATILFLPFVFLPAFFLLELFRNKETPVQNIGITLLGVAYVALPVSLINVLVFPFSHSAGFYSPDILAGLYILIILNDTVAYIVGVPFGKHRLMERISPKKSWEGMFGGVIATLVAGYFMTHLFPFLDLRQWFILALIVSVFGTLGDLAESMLKRSMKIKDSGSLLPGHGGILDRLDALLFVVPVAVFYLYYSGLKYTLP